jgi:hypothetical protein
MCSARTRGTDEEDEMHEYGIAVAADAAAIVTLGWFELRARRRRRRDAARAATRDAGIPRDVDLALAIADHLRLKYRPLFTRNRALLEATNEAMRVSLRAAAAIAKLLNYPPTETEEV